MAFDLESYEMVESRIARFYADHEDGSIRTQLLSDPANETFAMFEAFIYIDDKLVSTGHAQEQAGQGPVNRTSHLENAETSAIGRALANYKYSGKKRPSREEMEKTLGEPTKPSNKPAKTEVGVPSAIKDLFTKVTTKANSGAWGTETATKMNEARKALADKDEDTLKALLDD